MVNGKLVGDNINKIEAIYGTNFREALEDILYRTIKVKYKASKILQPSSIVKNNQ